MKSLWEFCRTHAFPLVGNIFAVLGVASLLSGIREQFNLLEGYDLSIPFWCFVIGCVAVGFVIHLVDGYFVRGYLKKQVTISGHGLEVDIEIKFADLFQEPGWKVIGVSDFFDSQVDEDLVSSKSLHGFTINTLWPGKSDDWQSQVDASLKSVNFVEVSREKGNTKSYPIGTTAVARVDDQKLLFVALSKADSQNNVTTSSVEELVCAVRGALRKARAVCSLEPLSIPLMGSGLARIGANPSVLTDLILAAVLEEARISKIRNEITIVLPVALKHRINLRHYQERWS